MRGDTLYVKVNKPWFIGAQGISLGVLFVGLFLGRRNRRLSNDPTVVKKKEVKQKVSRWVKEMDRAVAGHDVSVFFNACRSAAQERLGEIWSLPPETITLADVKEHLPESAGVRQVFETADAVAYSGRSFSQDELRQCRDLVIEELKNLDSIPILKHFKGDGGPYVTSSILVVNDPENSFYLGMLKAVVQG